MASPITVHDAIKRMREFTEKGIPFSFTYLSFNSKSQESEGFKTIDKAQLRKGYRDDQSDRAKHLIGYVHADGRNRWFHIALLVKFNDLTVL